MNLVAAKKDHNQMKTFLAGITLSLFTTVAGFAATQTVTNHDDSGPGSLRDAIANAAPGDTIAFELPPTRSRSPQTNC